MKSSSTRVLVVLLVAALFISLFGMFSTIDRFGWRALTGAWSTNATTTHGAVNLTISTNLVINFSDDTANFGSGSLCAGCSAVAIGTDGTNGTCNCGWNLPTGLMLENTGNRHALVYISNTNYTNSLLGGALSGYAWKFENFTDATCTGSLNFTAGVAPWGLYQNITATYLDTANWTLCSKFNYTAGSDKINISIKFHIGEDALARTVADIWTASARDAGQ